MATRTIDIPEDLQRDLDAKATAGGYADVGDYILDHLFANFAEPSSETFEEHLLKAMAEPGLEMTREDWEKKASQLFQRHPAKSDLSDVRVP